jgi:hypothetical protein
LKSPFGFLCMVESLDGDGDVIFGGSQSFLRRSDHFRVCGDRRQPFTLRVGELGQIRETKISALIE